MILSLDLGTSSLKCGLFDHIEGSMVKFARFKHPSLHQWVSLDALKDFVVSYKHKIKAIAISSQGPTIVPMINTEALRPVLYCDETPRIKTLPSQFLGKVLGFKAQNPAQFSNVTQFLTAGDFLLYLLSGQLATTLPFDMLSYQKAIWDEDQIIAYNFPRSQFPPLRLLAQQPCYTLERYGLPAGIPIVTVVFDFLAALIGSGCHQVQTIGNRGGMSEGINFFVPKVELAALQQTAFFKAGAWRCYPHVVDDGFNVGIVENNIGHFFQYYTVQLAKNSPLELLDSYLTAEISATSKLDLPYFWTKMSPNLTQFLAVCGHYSNETQFKLFLNHYLASYQHVIANWPYKTETIAISGALAMHAQLNQAKALATNKELIELATAHTELVGAALLALCALNQQKTISSELSKKFIRIKKHYQGER